MSSVPQKPSALARGLRPFRTAVLRGLTVVAPPLLTLVILLWIVRTLDYYILSPVVAGSRDVISRAVADVRTQLPADAVKTDDPTVSDVAGTPYKRLASGQYVPLSVYETVVKQSPDDPPTDGLEAYGRWVEAKYLRPWIVVPVFIVVFGSLMWVLGILFAAGLGRAFYGWIEQVIGRLPVVRAVYRSTKQVTNYVFSEKELEVTRVVAVEYPCRGIWSLAFVTNEGMIDVEAIAKEPMLTILVPTSPMPFSGYTMLVPKSEVLDVDLTVEQAIEYMVSCGVVLPPQQFAQEVLEEGKS
jgi:uncharacterized membrane protein